MNKALESQRKSPKQSRSKALVDSIFEATVRILPKVGSRQITTKKIADIAGVSVGSLYQYFPNKEAVLMSVMDTVMTAQAHKIQKKIDDVRGSTMEEFTAAMIDLGLEQFLGDRFKMREIFMQAPELGKVPSMYKLRQSFVEKFAVEMKRYKPGFENEEYTRVSFIAVNSVMGIVQTMLYDDQQNYSIKELSAELKIMLDGYFEKRTSTVIQSAGEG